MRYSLRLASVAAVVLGFAPSAVAQPSREAWVELRDEKQARQLRGPASTVTGVLTVLTVRFFSDAGGRLVAVGEARNDYSSPVAYARLDFAFYDAGGALIGSELTYVHGGTNALLPMNGRNETVLPPGQVGFFKVWSSVQASAMSTYTVTAYAEDLPFTAPIASTGPFRSPHPSIPWSPMVFVHGRFSFSGQRVSATILNDDPEPPCPCGHDSTFTYAVRVAVAAYQDGVISDVQTAVAQGPTAVAPCDEPASTGMALHQWASFAVDLERPADSIGRHAVEWAEVGTRPRRISFGVAGGVATFAGAALCTWTPAPTAPWIEVTDTPPVGAKAGLAAFRVHANSGAERMGWVFAGDMPVTVQQAGTCRPNVSPDTIFFGSGIVGFSLQRVSVTSACAWVATPEVPWLRVSGTDRGFNENFSVAILQPNLTGATRVGTISIGAATLRVVQSPGGRNSDFNADGHLDLVWQHQTDGRLGVWLMRGQHLIDARAPTPGQVADSNWKIVGAADLDERGSTDLVWQHAADGRLAYWEVRGTTLFRAVNMSPSSVADLDWKIRAVADFNADGFPDLVWQHAATGHIGLWTLRPLSVVTRTSAEPLGPGQVADVNWKIVGSGDFDRDGWPDLMWQHQADGRLAVWRMRGRTLLSADPLSPDQLADVNWKVRGVGDVNGDDKPDLLWQHAVSGDVAAWLMDGTRMVAGISLGRVADTNWQIVGPR